MDGPSVNWKFYRELKKKVHNDYGTTRINIGSCGLHVVHNSFQRHRCYWIASVFACFQSVLSV